jgi:hypothetical protein
MTLLDVVMAHAARTPGADGVAETSGVVTIEMKTTFLRPGTRPRSSAPAAACTAPRRWRSAKARWSMRVASLSRMRPHLQVPEGLAGGRQANPAPQRIRLKEIDMAEINRQIHLVSRPSGEASTDNFRLVEQPLGTAGEGQVLVRHHS